jgi:hypothetical protein
MKRIILPETPVKVNASWAVALGGHIPNEEE